MNRRDYISLFDLMHPNFFGQDYIRAMPREYVFDEMVLPLAEFDERAYERDLGDGVSFGFYDGDIDGLRSAVASVDEDWVKYFTADRRIYCGYVDGKVASFCIVDDLGTHDLGGRTVKVGGPGCVGTVPAYRDRGIGLTMVKRVTKLLKDEGYDYSYIHYTYVAPWYAKLGYKTSIRWNSGGIIPE